MSWETKTPLFFYDFWMFLSGLLGVEELFLAMSKEEDGDSFVITCLYQGLGGKDSSCRDEEYQINKRLES